MKFSRLPSAKTSEYEAFKPLALGIYHSLTGFRNGPTEADWCTKKSDPRRVGLEKTRRTVRVANARIKRELPRTLLMAIRLQALATLVFVHLQTALFLEITHGSKTKKVRFKKESVKLRL
tara:strand:+ start:983 stop:1342 length:360 start_codon:yes stop_codon:yes gene_type:complete